MCLLLQRFTGKAKMKVMLMKGYDLGRQKEQACFLSNTSKTDKGTFWWCTCSHSRSFPSSGVVELNGRNTFSYRCATKIFLWRPSLSKKQHLGKNNYDIKRQDKGWFVFFFFFFVCKETKEQKHIIICPNIHKKYEAKQWFYRYT